MYAFIANHKRKSLQISCIFHKGNLYVIFVCALISQIEKSDLIKKEHLCVLYKQDTNNFSNVLHTFSGILDSILLK